MSERVVHTPPESKGEAKAGTRLKGRRVLVLGGGQMDIGEANTPVGNGRAISVLCAREGAHVAVADRDWVQAEETVAMIVGEKGRATAIAPIAPLRAQRPRKLCAFQVKNPIGRTAVRFRRLPSTRQKTGSRFSEGRLRACSCEVWPIALEVDDGMFM